MIQFIRAGRSSRASCCAHKPSASSLVRLAAVALLLSTSIASASGPGERFAGTTALDDDQRWADHFNITNGCDGIIRAIAADSSGGIYLGGDFSSCGTTLANNIVHYDPDTDAWSPVGKLGNGTNHPVSAMTFYAGELIVAGEFDQVDAGAVTSTSANHIARWDGTEWHTLGTGGGNGTDQGVRALAAIGGDLYIGGRFTVVDAGGSNAVSANRVARWTGSQWQALGSGGGNGITGGPAVVEALALDGSDLYVGGRFNQANAGAAIQASNIARFDGSDWHSLGHPSSNGTGGAVLALAIHDGELIVAGDFDQVFNGPALNLQNMARWDGSDWSRLGPGPASGVLNGFPRALAALGDDLVVAGSFQTAVGATVTSVDGIALWDGNDFSGVDGAGSGLDRVVNAMATHEGAIYVGGPFLQTTGTPAVAVGRVARFEGGAWSALGSVDGLGITGTVYAVLPTGNGAYVGGDFSSAGDVPANNLAFWNGSEWSIVGSGAGNGTDGSVHALAFFGGELYVGGVFSNANAGDDVPANHLARWNGSNWSGLSASDGNGTNSYVYALAEFQNTLYVGGHFTAVEFNGSSPIAANRIAGWDGNGWLVLGTNGGNGTNNLVRALTVYDDTLIVGGSFDRVDINGSAEQTASHLASWDGAEWSALQGDGGEGVDNSVEALIVHDNELIAGGLFSQANLGNPVTVNRILRWNGTDFAGLGSVGGSGFNSYVHDLAVADGDLLAGGAFTIANYGGTQAYARGVARWDGSQWSALGSGTAGSARALTVLDNSRLLVGGSFGLAGGNHSAAIATYFLPADELFTDRFEPTPR